MTSLLAGMAYDTPYYWLIGIFRGSISYGLSFYMHGVTFHASAAAAPATDLNQLPAPVGDLSPLPAPLRRALRGANLAP